MWSGWTTPFVSRSGVLIGCRESPNSCGGLVEHGSVIGIAVGRARPDRTCREMCLYDGVEIPLTTGSRTLHRVRTDARRHPR